MLQLSRALQGIGGAIMFSVSLALLADAFRGKDRGVAFGVWGAITGLAVAIGPLLGGALTSGLSWRWIFFVNLPIGVVAVVLSLTTVAESKLPHGRRPDWVGFALFTLGLAALVYGLIESNQRSFSDPVVVGSLVAAAVLILGFVVAEARLKSPMFDLSLFRKPTFTGGAVAAFGLSASIFALLLYLVLYVQDVLRLQRLPDRPAAARALRRHPADVDHRRTADLARPDPVPDRAGPAARRRRPAADARSGRLEQLDAPHPRADRRRRRCRAGEPAARLDRDRRGEPGARRAWRRASTRRSARSASPPASRCSARCSAAASRTPSRTWCPASRASDRTPRSWPPRSSPAPRSRPRRTCPRSARPKVEQIAASAFTDALNHILLVAAIIVMASGVIALLTIRKKDLVHQGG